MAFRIPALAAAAGPLSLLAACAVGPTHLTPAAPSGTAFHNANRLRTRTAPAPGPELRTWWTGFNDAELTGLVGRALSQNLDLAQAEARVAQARAQAKASGAALLPTARLDAQAAYSHQSLESPLGRIESGFPGFDRDRSLYDLSAGASWEPDLFGGLRRGAEAARADYEASEAARAGSRITIAAATADAYVLVRTFQTRLAVVEDQARIQRRLFDLTRLRFSRGVAARLEVDQAQGGLAQTEAQAPLLRAGLEAQMEALEVLVGAEPGSLHAELSSPNAIPTPPAVGAGGGPAALVRRRPDIIAAERRLAASDARIGAAIADYYPRITLSGVVGFEAGDVGHLVGAAGFQPQGLVGLRWRLFDFGRVDAEVARARGERAEALARYRQTVLQATADVETSLVGLVERETQARTLGDGEAALQRARASAQAAYLAGRVSLIEVLDADARLFATRDQRVVAQSEAARAAIASFKALGGGWTS